MCARAGDLHASTALLHRRPSCVLCLDVFCSICLTAPSPVLLMFTGSCRWPPRARARRLPPPGSALAFQATWESVIDTPFAADARSHRFDRKNRPIARRSAPNLPPEFPPAIGHRKSRSPCGFPPAPGSSVYANAIRSEVHGPHPDRAILRCRASRSPLAAGPVPSAVRVLMLFALFLCTSEQFAQREVPRARRRVLTPDTQ